MTGSSLLETDTIAAVATAPGRGGVGIIRISGSAARTIGETLTGLALKPRHAHFSSYRGGITGKTATFLTSPKLVRGTQPKDDMEV